MSPPQARAFRRGIDVVTSAEISPSLAVPTMQYVFFRMNIYFKREIKLSSKAKVLRLVVKANSQSARSLAAITYNNIFLINKIRRIKIIPPAYLISVSHCSFSHKIEMLSNQQPI